MKLLPVLKELFEDFFSLIFPKICIHCGTPLVSQEEHLCTSCRLELPKTDQHLSSSSPLRDKLIYEPKVHAAVAYLHFHKQGLAQSIIHHLKYRGFQELGEEIGRWYGEDLKNAQWSVDMIVPVPLHKSKFRKRGYNQSECFANGLAQVLDVPTYPDSVSRIVKTNTQTRKSKVQRLENVKSIYRLKDPDEFKGRNVLIVDDVLTTGATVGELAMLIAKADPKGIYVATIAAGQ